MQTRLGVTPYRLCLVFNGCRHVSGLHLTGFVGYSMGADTYRGYTLPALFGIQWVQTRLGVTPDRLCWVSNGCRHVSGLHLTGFVGYSMGAGTSRGYTLPALLGIQWVQTRLGVTPYRLFWVFNGCRHVSGLHLTGFVGYSIGADTSRGYTLPALFGIQWVQTRLGVTPDRLCWVFNGCRHVSGLHLTGFVGYSMGAGTSRGYT